MCSIGIQSLTERTRRTRSSYPALSQYNVSQSQYLYSSSTSRHISELTLATVALPSDRRPLVISGPSGVGKGTLAQKLIEAHPNGFALVVSHTTRKPRAGEVEGVTYFFVSASTFSSLVSQNAFVEHALFSGHHYGTSKQAISDQTAKGSVAVLDIEMQGIKQVKSNPGIDARYVFIKPPSFEALEKRLRSRSTENEEDIRKRLARAKVELEHADKPGAYDMIIVNDDLEKAYKELEEFVYRPAALDGNAANDSETTPLSARPE